MITNPGGLIGKLTVPDLYKKSVPRNPLLLGLLQRMELAENAGTGLLRINNELAEYKLPPPVIEADKHFFSMIFDRPKTSYEERIYGDKKGLVENEGLNEGLKTLLALICENPGIKAKQASVSLGNRPIKTIERQIKVLIEKGFIERKGSRKTGGYWEIVG